MKKYTSIPVPDVHSWSSEAENQESIGAEYIIMSKAEGVSLGEKWLDMPRKDKQKVIDRVVDIESELASLDFPAYGNLYLRSDFPAGRASYPLSSKQDPEGLFCVGPDCFRIWVNEDYSGMKANEGPCTFCSLSASPFNMLRY